MRASVAIVRWRAQRALQNSPIDGNFEVFMSQSSRQ
jgi:hypothetical protein